MLKFLNHLLNAIFPPPPPRYRVINNGRNLVLEEYHHTYNGYLSVCYVDSEEHAKEIIANRDKPAIYLEDPKS